MGRRLLHLSALLLLFSITAVLLSAQYVLGPRGGCYTFTKSGNKKYVDRSLCSDAGSKVGQSSSYPKSRQQVDPANNNSPSVAPPSGFLRGPRGGCYTLSPSGTKRYVDRSLCDANTSPPGNAQANQPAQTTKQPAAASSRYIRGPRGGCYTLSPSGSKRYVDRSLCQ